MDSLPPQPPELLLPSPHIHFWNKKFILTLTLLILFGGASLATVWQVENQLASQEVAPTFTPRADATAGWKTYTNTQYGFEFKYPSDDWVLQDGKELGISSDYNTVEITKTLSSTGDYQRVEFTSSNQNLEQGITNDGTISFSGVNWLESEFNDGVPGQNSSHDSLAYFTKIGSTYYEIVLYPVDGPIFGHNKKVDSLLTQILSTFKFSDSATSNTYQNNQYGFSIALPDSWAGYTVLNSQWQGRDVATGTVTEHGPIITLRHPLWTTTKPREDMPVMIFTPAQWALVQSEKLAVSAAPIPPSVLGQNSKYIIALPARYNYDFKTGWEEVDQLVHTLKAFEPSSTQVDTGTLTGHVTIGPNCPVEQAGHPCTPSPQAYTSRQVMVYKADGTTLVTTQNFDAQGNYNINLPTGIYVVKSRTGINTTAQVVGTVTTKASQTTTLNFSIDTGIR